MQTIRFYSNLFLLHRVFGGIRLSAGEEVVEQEQTHNVRLYVAYMAKDGTSPIGARRYSELWICIHTSSALVIKVDQLDKEDPCS